MTKIRFHIYLLLLFCSFNFTAHSSNFLEGENNIIKYLKTSKIFVGTSGTSIYETAYSKIPSLLFQISKNQENRPLKKTSKKQHSKSSISAAK